MTEQQKYRVVRTIGDGQVELRRYDACVMADIVVSGDYRQATYRGFGPLVSYISRNNIAMTAPVVQDSAAEESWRVSFVMPAGADLSAMPTPEDREVTLRQVPEHDAAAIRFSGMATRFSIKRQEARLRAALAAEGIRAIGEPRVARFDPPWTPPFMRHNEVVVDVAS